ncbi:MAG: outer membrane protein transport protein [Deltaproteobacteria bacterium]|nr:outer membrane protein transport protein [Deltaproteobacteria bacterium]
MSSFPRRFSLVLGAAVSLGCLAASGDASASGYLTARFGADHGTPVMPNTYAVYFNPAALGGTTGTTILGDASILLRWAQYRRGADALSPSDKALLNDANYVNSNTGKANLLNLLALPFLGMNTDFGGSKYFRGGFAVYVPFGGFATWDRLDEPVNGTPGTVDRVSRWHNISGQILALYNTFAFAVKPHPRFSIGINVSPVIHLVSTVRARNADGSDDTIKNGTLVEGRSLLEASGVNLAMGGGLYWEATDNLRFGLSYSAPPGLGETKLSGDLTAQLGAQPSSVTKIDFTQSYPDIVRFGAAGKLNEKWELRGDFEYVRWSVFRRQCVFKAGTECDANRDGYASPTSNVILNVPRNWNDAIGVRVGPAYQLNDSVELFGSLGMTTPAVPKETIDASTIDAVRLYGTFGGRFVLSKHIALAASYNHIYFFDVDTKGRSLQNLPNNPETAYHASRSPSANGTYRSQIGFVNVNLAYTF